MVKKPAGKSMNLAWEWRPEIIKDTLKGSGSFINKQLLEQINTTSDANDYLWYMTSVKLNKKDRKNLTLRVNTTGHLLHAYVNKKLTGSQYATNGNYKFLFERELTPRKLKLQVTLLSATVGLTNYGSFFDMVPAGIVGGPVQLIVNGTNSIDLSSNIWSYKIGLNGERKMIYSVPNKFKWFSEIIFEVPTGEDPLALDLQALGKGQAWVKSDICKPCDYRKNYDSDVCRTGCGEPSQRWYHVPRFFTKPGPNPLVLFEEFGGNSSQVNLRLVTVGTACSNALEGSTLELSCQGNRTFNEIQFASFGNPQGTCSSFQKSSCDAIDALSVVQKVVVTEVFKFFSHFITSVCVIIGGIFTVVKILDSILHNTLRIVKKIELYRLSLFEQWYELQLIV